MPKAFPSVVLAILIIGFLGSRVQESSAPFRGRTLTSVESLTFGPFLGTIILLMLNVLGRTVGRTCVREGWLFERDNVDFTGNETTSGNLGKENVPEWRNWQTRGIQKNARLRFRETRDRLVTRLSPYHITL